MAATSFGHVTTNDIFPPSTAGYRAIRGTVFDVLDKHGVTWADYFQDAPLGASLRLLSLSGIDLHFLPLPVFLRQTAGVPGLRSLPKVSFLGPNFGLLGTAADNDAHPTTNIQRGQAYVSLVVTPFATARTRRTPSS